MHTPFKALMGAAFLLSAAPAFAGSGATGSARITATVPEVCNISANPFVLNANGRFTGSVQEFCNGSSSYQILATHRPLDAGEAAEVQYGGTQSVLNAAGMSLIAIRSGQRIARVNVVIDARSINSPLAVAFTMSAI